MPAGTPYRISISEGEGITCLIKQETCVERRRHHDAPQCVSVRPVEGLVLA